MLETLILVGFISLVVLFVIFIFFTILGYGLGGLIMGFGLVAKSFAYVYSEGNIIGLLLYFIFWCLGFPFLFWVFFILGVIKFRRAYLDNPEDPYGEKSINEIDE